MNDKQLMDIESIRQLKGRYCRTLDTKQWDAWLDCFSDDFTALYTGPHPDIEFSSRDELVALNREMLAEVRTVHQVFNPEIEITGPDSARGIWPMYDRVEFPDNAFEAWGHYHEQYRKVGGEWKISRIELTRLTVNPLQLESGEAS